jgi:P-type E1-E2 ATPase
MKEITIPNFKDLSLEHIVLDYNGTVARDGELLTEAKELIQELQKEFHVHIITADTFGSVQKQCRELDVTVKILASDDHTKEKADYIQELGATHCAAIGNGNNDASMLERAVLGIAVVGAEGCAASTLLKADLIVNSIQEALSLFRHPKRLVATLRR